MSTLRKAHWRVGIERMKLIARFLRAGRPFTCQTIMKRFECSRKTVVRDIEFMGDRLRWDIYFDASQQTYRLRSAPDPQL